MGVMRICKHCGKNIWYSEIKEKTVDICNCTNCGKPLGDSFTKTYTKEEEFMEDLSIANMVKERESRDTGVRYTLEEAMEKRKEAVENRNRLLNEKERLEEELVETLGEILSDD